MIIPVYQRMFGNFIEHNHMIDSSIKIFCMLKPHSHLSMLDKVAFILHFLVPIFQDPIIKGIQPLWGPVSGGTEITIHGENLNTGRIITASIDSTECVVSRYVT